MELRDIYQKLIDRWEMSKDKIRNNFRIIVISLGLYKSPMRLLNLIIVVLGIIGGLYAYIPQSLKLYFIIILLFVLYLFIDNMIYLMFPPSRWAKTIVDAYDTNPKIISFIARNVKKWLEDITKFIIEQPEKDDIKNCIEKEDINELRKLRFRLSSTDKTIEKLEKKGNYLNDLIIGTSYSFRIPQESFEELVNTKIDVNQKIGKEIINSYIQTQESIEKFIDESNLEAHAGTIAIRDSHKRNKEHYSKKIKDTIEDIRKKQERIESQIEWLNKLIDLSGGIRKCVYNFPYIKKFEKRIKIIHLLIEIIKESSTGNALNKLSRLLIQTESLEDLMWLIRFTNSRKGFPISKLLGLELDEKANPPILNWYGKQISDNIKSEKEFLDFLKYFDRYREDALNLLWDKFIKWNEFKYLFSWEDISQDNYGRFREYLIQNSGANWRSANFEEIGNNTINVSTKENSLSLQLNQDKTKAILTFDDGRTDEFIVKKENGKLNIHRKKYLFSWDGILGNDSDSFINYLSQDLNVDWVKETFSWNEIPGKDSCRFIEFLIHNFEVEWIRAANIKKSNDGKTIDISDGKNAISLKLHDSKTKVNLKIDACRTDEFIAKMENGTLSIYKTAVIKKFDEGIINVSTKDNSLSLRLNNEKTKAILTFDDGRTDEFIAMMENGMLNIYEKIHRLDFSGSIAIGLTYGYSAALKRVLKQICKYCDNIKGLRIILIRTNDAPGDEELLRAELIADYRELKCDIMPIEVIEQKEIQLQMRSIFVGLESINKRGDIVHPRGGSEIIREIKKYNPDIKVYAFGESYKVLNFTEEDIDYTKLSLFRSKNVNYVVTDDGVHERKDNKWQKGNVLADDLSCCEKSWENIYKR